VRSPSHVAAAGAAVLELAAGGLRVLPEVRGNHGLAGRPELRLQLRLLPGDLPAVLRVHGPHPGTAHPGHATALRGRGGAEPAADANRSGDNGARLPGDVYA